jgi:hypothetical protein
LFKSRFFFPKLGGIWATGCEALPSPARAGAFAAEDLEEAAHPAIKQTPNTVATRRV